MNYSYSDIVLMIEDLIRHGATTAQISPLIIKRYYQSLRNDPILEKIIHSYYPYEKTWGEMISLAQQPESNSYDVHNPLLAGPRRSAQGWLSKHYGRDDKNISEKRQIVLSFLENIKELVLLGCFSNILAQQEKERLIERRRSTGQEIDGLVALFSNNLGPEFKDYLNRKNQLYFEKSGELATERDFLNQAVLSFLDESEKSFDFRSFLSQSYQSHKLNEIDRNIPDQAGIIHLIERFHLNMQQRFDLYFQKLHDDLGLGNFLIDELFCFKAWIEEPLSPSFNTLQPLPSVFLRQSVLVEVLDESRTANFDRTDRLKESYSCALGLRERFYDRVFLLMMASSDRESRHDNAEEIAAALIEPFIVKDRTLGYLKPTSLLYDIYLKACHISIEQEEQPYWSQNPLITQEQLMLLSQRYAQEAKLSLIEKWHECQLSDGFHKKVLESELQPYWAEHCSSMLREDLEDKLVELFFKKIEILEQNYEYMFCLTESEQALFRSLLSEQTQEKAMLKKPSLCRDSIADSLMDDHSDQAVLEKIGAFTGFGLEHAQILLCILGQNNQRFLENDGRLPGFAVLEAYVQDNILPEFLKAKNDLVLGGTDFQSWQQQTSLLLVEYIKKFYRLRPNRPLFISMLPQSCDDAEIFALLQKQLTSDTNIFYACPISLLKLLLKKNKITLSDAQQTALMGAAIDIACSEAVQFLLEYGSVNLGYINYKKQNFLIQAAEKGCFDIVKLLLEIPIFSEHIDCTDLLGCTALCYAIELRRHDIMAYLLDSGARGSAKDHIPAALTQAIFSQNDIKALNILLRYPFFQKSLNNIGSFTVGFHIFLSRTLLDVCLILKKLKYAKTLAAAGADISIPTRAGGLNIVMEYSSFSKEHEDCSIIIQLLEEAPVLIGKQQALLQQNNLGQTALLLALSHHHNDLCLAFLKHGAQPTCCDLRGENALFYAIRQKNISFVEALSQRDDFSSFVNAQNASGQTALMLACSLQSNFFITSLLLKHQADPFIQDSLGANALIYATRACCPGNLKSILEKSSVDSCDLIEGSLKKIADELRLIAQHRECNKRFYILPFLFVLSSYGFKARLLEDIRQIGPLPRDIPQEIISCESQFNDFCEHYAFLRPMQLNTVATAVEHQHNALLNLLLHSSTIRHSLEKNLELFQYLIAKTLEQSNLIGLNMFVKNMDYHIDNNLANRIMGYAISSNKPELFMTILESQKIFIDDSLIFLIVNNQNYPLLKILLSCSYAIEILQECSEELKNKIAQCASEDPLCAAIYARKTGARKRLSDATDEPSAKKIRFSF